MNSWLPLAALAGAFISAVRADSEFLQPPAAGPSDVFQDNPVYDVGEKIDMQWTSDLEYMDLSVWQKYPTATDDTFWYIDLLNNSRSTSLIWTVTLDGMSDDIPEGEFAVLYLTLYQHGNDLFDAGSHYFNVSRPTITTTTASTPGPTTTHQGSNPTDTSTPAQTTDADADAGGSGDDGGGDGGSSGLSKGGVAGVAVGATIGGLALLGALGFFAWRHFRKAPGDASGTYDPASQMAPAAGYGSPSTGHMSQAYGHMAPGMGQMGHQEYYKPMDQQPTSELAGSTWSQGHDPRNNANGPGGLHEVP